METIASGQSHDYDGQILPYTLKSVVVNGIKFAEMVTVAVGTWGGEIHLLTIIKPINFSSPFLPFETDPYGEEYDLPWLEANA